MIRLGEKDNARLSLVKLNDAAVGHWLVVAPAWGEDSQATVGKGERVAILSGIVRPDEQVEPVFSHEGIKGFSVEVAKVALFRFDETWVEDGSLFEKLLCLGETRRHIANHLEKIIELSKKEEC